jgi:hypothetical protein
MALERLLASIQSLDPQDRQVILHRAPRARRLELDPAARPGT